MCVWCKHTAGEAGVTMPTHAHTWVQIEMMPGVPLHHSLASVPKTGSPHWYGFRLAASSSHGSSYLHPLQQWVIGMHSCSQFFIWVLGFWLQVLVLVEQELNRWFTSQIPRLQFTVFSSTKLYIRQKRGRCHASSNTLRCQAEVPPREIFIRYLMF